MTRASPTHGRARHPRFRLDPTATRARVIGRDGGSGTRRGHDSRNVPPAPGVPGPAATDRPRWISTEAQPIASARRPGVASAHRVDRRRGPSTTRAFEGRTEEARERDVDRVYRDVVRRGRATGGGDDARASASSSSSTSRGRWRHRAREAMGANVGRGHRARRWERRGGRYVNGVK